MKAIKQLRFVKFVVVAALIVGFSLAPLRSVEGYGASEAPAYVSQFGGTGAGDGQLSNPYGMTIDSHDNIFVADRLNSRIQKFDSNGTFISKFGSVGSGNGQLSSPRGIEVDSAGNIYVADTSNHRVQKFDSTGAYVTKWGSNGAGDGQFSFPNDIAIDSTGNVYVTELGNRVQKFDSSGTFISKFGSAGSGNGQFSGLASITIDRSGNLLVVDGNNSRVQKFDSSGNFISKFASYGTGDGQLASPNAGYLALDVYGNIYITDTYSSRIEKFDSNGNFLVKFGSFGTGDGQYDRTTGMAINSTGSVYITDYGHSRIQKYTYPAETANAVNTVSGTNIVLETPNMTDITCNQSVAEGSLPTQDADKNYPLGLVNFCLTVPTGSTNTINIMFETNLMPSEVSARKYNSVLHTYAPISGASISETTFNSNHALKLTYSITDGGVLDDDGIVNGVVHDPAGLATVAAPIQAGSTATLANTGTTQAPYTLLAITLVISGTVILLYPRYFRRNN